jgi:hypothetical protein
MSRNQHAARSKSSSEGFSLTNFLILVPNQNKGGVSCLKTQDGSWGHCYYLLGQRGRPPAFPQRESFFPCFLNVALPPRLPIQRNQISCAARRVMARSRRQATGKLQFPGHVVNKYDSESCGLAVHAKVTRQRQANNVRRQKVTARIAEAA